MIWIPQGVGAAEILDPGFAPVTWRVADSLARSVKMAAQLRLWGIKPGDRIVVIGKNSPWHLVTFVAASALPAITVPLDQNLPAEVLAKVLGHCEPSLIICDSDQLARMEDGIGRLEKRPRVVTYGELEDYVRPVDEPMGAEDLALVANRLLADLATCDDDTPGAVIYTSGTAAEPKGTLLTYKNMWWGCTNFREVFEYSPATVEAVTAPLSHIGGFNGTTTDIFSHGGTVVIFEKFSPEAILAAIEKYRIEMMFAVPTMYRMLVEHLHASEQSGHRFDTSSFTRALVGGAAWDKKLAKTTIELGWNPINIWGMTEQSASGAALTTEVMPGRELAVGLPFPHTELRACDQEGNPVPAGVVGQLECRGPSVTSTYFRNPALTAAMIDPETGWLKTGDLGYFDPEGFLHLVGRITDTINSGGEKVFASRVAAVVSKYPGVLEAQVLGVPDSTWGEIVGVALVMQTDHGTEPHLEELQEFARPYLSKAELPRVLRIIDRIPLNSNGKPDHTNLLKFFN